MDKQEFEIEYQQAIDMFGKMCVDELINSSLTEGALPFLNNIDTNHDKIIISAGTETELQQVFAIKKLEHLFADINGGPRTKFEIFADVLKRYPDATPLYFGDAEADYIVAKQYNIDYVFLSGYTESSGWEDFFHDKTEVTIINNFSELLAHYSFT